MGTYFPANVQRVVTRVPKQALGLSVDGDEDELTMESNIFTKSPFEKKRKPTKVTALVKAKAVAAPSKPRTIRSRRTLKTCAEMLAQTLTTTLPKATSSLDHAIDLLSGAVGHVATPPSSPASSPAADTVGTASSTSKDDALTTTPASTHPPKTNDIEFARLPTPKLTPVSTDPNDLKRKPGTTQLGSPVKKKRVFKERPTETPNITRPDKVVVKIGGEVADADEKLILLSDDCI